MLGTIYYSAEIQELERNAFAAGVDNAELMRKAGAGVAGKILAEERSPGICIVFAGKGNNGGDAFVAALHLHAAGWQIWVRLLAPVEALSPTAAEPWRDLAPKAVLQPEPITSLPPQTRVILLDGILGVGARAPLHDGVRHLVEELNRLRERFSARVYAIDIPTGVTDEAVDEGSVRADATLTITFPKTALVRDDATDFVGRIDVVDLPELAQRADPEAARNRPLVSYPQNLRELAPLRHFESHKGNYGRVGIVAGSRDYPGAARLCATAAARAGAGLIYLYVLPEAHPLMAVSLPPEIIIKTVETYASVVHERLDALGLGPGLGHERATELLDLIQHFPGPMVVDADGLNLIVREKPDPHILAHPRLFTPHPGEMARLWPTEGKTRAEIVQEYVREMPVTLLLKGARTVIGQAGKALAYNSTGTAGQATGGSGDVLTGVCTALMGRKLTPYDAARLGAWLCGRASELAVGEQSEESMLPTDTIAFLGCAYQDLRGQRK
jgi:hydroxyethylthiazole kinase-like uncharacterized protein yjeF